MNGNMQPLTIKTKVAEMQLFFKQYRATFSHKVRCLHFNEKSKLRSWR